MARKRQQYDSRWKKILTSFFRPAMELCFPVLAQDVDWSREIEFLEQELKRISRRSATGDRYVDKLARLWLRNGTEQRILLHLELQAQQRVAYEEHVFEYNVLARLFYKLPVVSVAILADSNPQWWPTTYKTALWGCEHTFRFPIVKLLDIACDEQVLLCNQNPFAIVVLAHVQSMKASKDFDAKYQWKKRLVQLGYQRGYDRETIVDLFTFIDWVMVLPDEMEIKFEAELSEFEKVQRMEYVTSIERRGIEQGKKTGQENVILRQLNRRLGKVDSYLENNIRALDTAALEALAEALLDFQSINDLTLWFTNNRK